MNLEGPYWNLCTEDTRHPIYKDLHFEEEDGAFYEYEGLGTCGCDNCFYGRTKLTLEILRLRDENSN
jgi:hypothetical protein